ncbi:MAG TPA: helix-hairpin-helix domain-containing protein, partial [Candidatus Saccharimonadales bacterium]|nr:helix-hairpin-helix domain-containing protein [Candidatus Saccharimonadales bacterium]
MPSLPRTGRVLAVALALIPLLVLSQGTASAATELNAQQETHLLTTMSNSPAKSLKYLPGMTDESISKVLAFREGGKKFTSVKQFKEVSGITAAQWEQLAKRYSGILADRREPERAPAAGRP